MIKKRYVIVALGVVAVLFGSLFYSTVISAPGGEYDPWLDYNEDGIVDVNDLHSLSQVYSSSGDPTKNVTVTNWPISEDVTVWYGELLIAPNYLFSPEYEASGFGQLHVVALAQALTPNKFARITIMARASWGLVPINDLWVNHTGTPSPSGSITVPVPSGTFQFWVRLADSTSCSVYLSFYLTWS